MAYDLYLPESWTSDQKRRRAAKVPEEIEFRTKPFIAAEQIREALKEGIPAAPVLADAAYGNDSMFRQALSDMGLDYLVGIQSTLSVWPPGMEPLKPKEWKGKGRRPKLLQRSAEHQPTPVEALALGLPASAWKKISWRKGTKETLRSRFAAVQIVANLYTLFYNKAAQNKSTTVKLWQTGFIFNKLMYGTGIARILFARSTFDNDQVKSLSSFRGFLVAVELVKSLRKNLTTVNTNRLYPFGTRN